MGYENLRTAYKAAEDGVLSGIFFERGYLKRGGKPPLYTFYRNEVLVNAERTSETRRSASNRH